MKLFLGRSVLVLLSLLVICMFAPSVATAQGNVIQVTICDAPDIEGCEEKTRQRSPFRMIFDPEVLEIECEEEDGACTNEDSRVIWDVVNKQDDHDADLRFTGRERHRRAFTEQRIRRGKRRSVSERPRNLRFENGEVRWRYEMIVRDAEGKIYARKDPEIIIRRRN